MTEQERRFFDLPDGRKLPLPLFPNLDEFALPGNFREFTQGRFWAFFDGETGTGMICRWDDYLWHSHHPQSRETFWAYCEDLIVWSEEVDRNSKIVNALGISLGVPPSEGGMHG